MIPILAQKPQNALLGGKAFCGKRRKGGNVE
jgi:hypothetical protein